MAEILETPSMIAEARQVAPMLRQLARAGCDADAVKTLLQPLVLVFGVGDGARTAAFWNVYKKALCGLPLEAVRAAVDEYTTLPDSEFFPKPGPLKALAEKHAGPIYKAASRAWSAARAKPQPRPVEATPEQRRAFADEVMAQFGLKRMDAA